MPAGVEPTAEDGEGPYSRDRLERMNADFCERLERAIRLGLERVPPPRWIVRS
jgi:hypothetical protein